MIRRPRLLRSQPHALLFIIGLVLVVWPAGRQLGAQQAADPLEVIPPAWVDLPEAPFVARVTLGRAVLVNRADRTFDSVSTGCVRQDGGRVRIVGGLFRVQISDGAYTPGREVEGMLRMVNNIDHYIEFYSKSLPDLLKRCPTESKIAVTAASARSGYSWSAEGTPWPN